VPLVADTAALDFDTFTTFLNVAYNQETGGDFTAFTVQLDVGAKLTFTGQTDTEQTNNGLFPGIYEPNDIIEIVVYTMNEGGETVSNIVNSLSADPSAFSIVPLTPVDTLLLAPGESTSTTYRVTVLPRPRLEKLHVRYEYPRYTRLKRREEDLDYRDRPLGSAACGPQPLEKYELRPHDFQFSLRLAPLDTDNITAEQQARLGIQES